MRARLGRIDGHDMLKIGMRAGVFKMLEHTCGQRKRLNNATAKNCRFYGEPA